MSPAFFVLAAPGGSHCIQEDSLTDRFMLLHISRIRKILPARDSG